MKTNEKATLEFNLEDPCAKNAFKRASSATDVYITLHEILNDVFRPARKHGYSNPEINQLIDDCGETKDEQGRGSLLVGKLEDMVHTILAENGIDLSDLE